MVAMPVLFVDERMPQLKDTEIRVVLAVLRQTRVVGCERQTAWVTHRELCRRTGRSSESVSAAITGLIRQGMLSVTDSTGEVLRTTAQRKAANGKRYYQVHLSTIDRERPGFSEGVSANAGRIVNPCILYTPDICRNPASDADRYREKAMASGEERTEKESIEAEKARIRERLREIKERPVLLPVKDRIRGHRRISPRA